MHVGQGAKVLSGVNEGQSVVEPVLLVLQVLEQAFGLKSRRVIVDVHNVKICVVLSL